MDKPNEPPTSKPRRSFERSLSAVAADESERRRSDRNVVCVGFGLKYVRGRPTLQAALQYHVLKKLDTAEAVREAGSEPIPSDVAGYPTDVLEWRVYRASACPGEKKPTGERGGRKENPLVGGTSTTVLGDWFSFPTGYGTLGGVCFDSASGSAMALSNAHVYGDDLGNDAIQPWLPTDEYLEAALTYLTCGGPLSHLFTWTAPSPLTGILTTAAAAAWVAAIASDAEDPSRWGQRTGAVPAAGVRTRGERIGLKAEVPPLPFPGRIWSAETGWDYTRETSSGTSSTATAERRPNEHVLLGKRVLTDRPTYRAGNTVTICAELLSRGQPVAPSSEIFTAPPVDRFVVAHCFPLRDPSRITKRVLVRDRGRCQKVEPPRPVCVRGFEPQIEGHTLMGFRIIADPFILWSEAPATRLLYATEDSNPSGVNALQLPGMAPLVVTCPPSTHVTLDVFGLGGRQVHAVAYSANGRRAATATSSGGDQKVETLTLSGVEIVKVELEGDGEAYLAGICVDKRPVPREMDGRLVGRTTYSGTLELDSAKPAGVWGVVVVSQTLDDTPTGGDPIEAARKLGGIADSANVVENGVCACTVLFDTTFAVVSEEITILR
jgi:hypothetical protein